MARLSETGSAKPTDPSVSFSWINTNVDNRFNLQHMLVPLGPEHYKMGVNVGRVIVNNDLLPCSVERYHGFANFISDGKPKESPNYQLFCMHHDSLGVEWIQSSDGSVPSRAVPVGYTTTSSYRETLYTGRVNFSGRYILGKIQPSHGCCYFPSFGVVFNSNDYEVMTYR